MVAKEKVINLVEEIDEATGEIIVVLIRRVYNKRVKSC